MSLKSYLKDILVQGLIYFSIFIILLVAIYRPYPLGPAQYPTILLDNTSIGAPIHISLQHAIANGEFPGWEPNIFCGAMPIYANIFSPVYYPLNLIFYLTPWSKNLNTAAPVVSLYLPLIHQLLAFIGMYLLLFIVFSKLHVLCFVGSVWYALSPCVLISVLGTSTTIPLTWLPWLCLICYFSEKHKSYYLAMVAGVLIGFSWLGSHYQFTFYTIVGYCLWWIWCILSISGFQIKKIFLSIFRPICSFSIAIGIYSIHLIPFILYYNHHGWPQEIHDEFLNEGGATLNTFFRSFFLFEGPLRNQPWLYVLDGQITWGAVGTTLIIFTCISTIIKNTRNVNLFILACIFLFTCALMMGYRSPLWTIIGKLPGFGSFHYPQRIRILAQFFGTILAIYGLNWILFNSRHKTQQLIWTFIAIAILIITIVVGKAISGVYHIHSGSFISSLLLIGVAILFGSEAKIKKTVFITFLVIFCIIDIVGLSLLYYQETLKGDMLVYTRHEKPLLQVDGHPLGPGRTPMVEFLIKQNDFYRYYNMNEYWEGSYMIPLAYKNVYSIDGFAGNYEKLFAPYVPEYRLFRNHISPNVLDLLNVKFIIAPLNEKLEEKAIEYGRSRDNYIPVLYDSIRNSMVYINATALPRAYLVKESIVNQKPTLDDLEKMDFRSIVILNENPEQEILKLKQEISSTEYISGPKTEIKDITNNTATFLVNVPWDHGYLFYSDCYHPGWNCKIDNNPAKIFKANLAFKAVIVPKGDHIVKMKFHPPGLWSGLGISLFTLIFMLFLTLGKLQFKFFKRKSI